MAQSHELIFRRIIRRFGSFPIQIYSSCILKDDTVPITYKDVSDRTFNFYIMYTEITRRVQIPQCMLANIRPCDSR